MKKHTRENESEDFRCRHCRAEVPGTAIGTRQRNHCPVCLYSLHVDESIGDRLSSCQSSMRPIDLTTKKDGEVMIVHRCELCGKVSNNRIAGDDNTDELVRLAKASKQVSAEEVNIQLFGRR